MSAARAVVLVSGGLDSATLLALARDQGRLCHALSFDYGQRHRVELDAAARVVGHLGCEEHRIMRIDAAGMAGSALTEASMAVPESPSEGIPSTYVPARNTVFLAMALGWAEVLEADAIYIGINAVDYSGYPDCRPRFIDAFQRLADVATRAAVQGGSLRIEAPLIHLSKAEIIRAGTDAGVDYSLTVSCYQPDEQGLACGLCDSCRLRRAGFLEAGVPDPTRYRPSAR